MNIRPAVKEDAQAAARLLYDALHDIAHQLTGQESEEDALRDLAFYFEQEEGRLSYHQCLVSEVDGKAAGLIVTYGGDEAKELDRPMVERLRELKNDPSFTLDKEADEDEFYIDTLSVSSSYKGMGIGSALIRAAEARAKERGYGKIALAVVTGNKRAYSLYLRTGYEVDKEIIINKHVYFHMVKHLE
ncbi:GNAT family N-acetyltransferase [Paenibacillus dakarensis]|uniref:GNAT family N-acetyltransferase n=1 Tax=Paenibacillus dakarensis TaxID=1527293 RepID=UPI0006D539AC|nr:GNAT family N-acetyltransferase [Paenibacillus dakarensis]